EADDVFDRSLWDPSVPREPLAVGGLEIGLCAANSDIHERIQNHIHLVLFDRRQGCDHDHQSVPEVVGVKLPKWRSCLNDNGGLWAMMMLFTRCIHLPSPRLPACGLGDDSVAPARANPPPVLPGWAADTDPPTPWPTPPSLGRTLPRCSLGR